MGLLTDDCDKDQNELSMFVGGNGDYYILIKETNGKRHSVRVATCGGIAPLNVLLAVANLYREMEAAGLNS